MLLLQPAQTVFMSLIISVSVLNSNTIHVLDVSMSQQLSSGNTNDSGSYKKIDDACMNILFRINQEIKKSIGSSSASCITAAITDNQI